MRKNFVLLQSAVSVWKHVLVNVGYFIAYFPVTGGSPGRNITERHTVEVETKCLFCIISSCWRHTTNHLCSRVSTPYRSTIMYMGLCVRQAMSEATEMMAMTGTRRCGQLLGHGAGRA